MEDGDIYSLFWLDQKLGKNRKTRIVSKYEMLHSVGGLACVDYLKQI